MMSAPDPYPSHHLSRRDWLHRMSASTLGIASGLVAKNVLAAPTTNAWASSYRPFDAPAFAGSLSTQHIVVKGKLPSALRGTLYRNGPARFARGNSHLTHWFDGDGMVQAVRMEDGKASHVGRLLDTPKAKQEEAAGRFLYGGFGSTVPNSAPIENAEMVNAANINLLPMDGGRSLYALWEGGSAIQVEPDTLATIGLKTWSPETQGAPFSAHPRVSQDGTVWNFGYMPGTGKLLIYHIAANGTLQRQAVLAVPQADMVHDFAMTENHLIFLLQPLKFTRPETAALPHLLAGMQWDAQAPMMVCVVKKSDLRHQLMTLPNGGVFHLGNAWEDSDTIRFGYARQADILSTMNHLHIDHSGKPELLNKTQWIEVEINLSQGKAIQRDTKLLNVEFPRWNPRRTGLPSDLTLLLQRSAEMDAQVMGFDTVLALAHGQVQRHSYGQGWIAEEHLVVPHPTDARESAGWVMGSAYHWETEKTTVSIFNADAVAQGPVAQLHLPYGLPLGLHGQFVPT